MKKKIHSDIGPKLWFPRKAVSVYYGRNVTLCGVLR